MCFGLDVSLRVALLSRPQAEKNSYTECSILGVYCILSPSLFFFLSILYTNGCQKVVLQVFRIPLSIPPVSRQLKRRYTLSFFPFFLFFLPSSFFLLFLSLRGITLKYVCRSINYNGMIQFFYWEKILNMIYIYVMFRDALSTFSKVANHS